MAQDTSKTTFPLFQVKAAGTVIEQTNSEITAMAAMRGATKPAQLWQIHSSGKANLLKYSQ